MPEKKLDSNPESGNSTSKNNRRRTGETMTTTATKQQQQKQRQQRRRQQPPQRKQTAKNSFRLHSLASNVSSLLSTSSSPGHLHHHGHHDHITREKCKLTKGCSSSILAPLKDMPISTIQCLKLLQLLRGGMGRMDEKLHLLGSQVQELHESICGSIIRNVRV